MIGGRVIGKIEASAHIGPNVTLGKNNYVGHGAVIEGRVVIGDNNYIGNHCVIGVRAQNATHRYEINDELDCAETVIIGSNNVIREFTTVHRPMDTETRIGSYCYLMAYNHVSHDTQLADRVILANNVQIGGYTRIHSYANVGLSSVVHQLSTIGAHAMIGMGSIVSKDIPPFAMVMGNPVSFSGKINSIGLQRNGFSADEAAAIARFYGDATGAVDAASLPARMLEHLEAFAKDSRRKTLPICAPVDAWVAARRKPAGH